MHRHTPSSTPGSALLLLMLGIATTWPGCAPTTPWPGLAPPGEAIPTSPGTAPNSGVPARELAGDAT
ncbi:MAG: hypothetical protein AAFX99_12780, partial [Myxococcota bacterium]